MARDILIGILLGAAMAFAIVAQYAEPETEINFLKKPPKDLIGWLTEPKPDSKWGKDYMFTFTTAHDCTFSQEGNDFKTYLVKCEAKNAK